MSYGPNSQLQSSASYRGHPTKFLLVFDNFSASHRQLDGFSLHLARQNAKLQEAELPIVGKKER